MRQELTLPTETLEQTAEAVTIAAVTASINAGFNPAGTRAVTVKQVVDTCAIIITFLREIENAPQERTIAQWRAAVENLRITMGGAS